MSTLKYFRNWILLIIAFYIFSSGIIYLWLNSEEIGMKIYNVIHRDEIVNQVEETNEVEENY